MFSKYRSPIALTSPRGLLLGLFLFALAVAFIPILQSFELRKSGQHGLLGKYYGNARWEGKPIETKVDPSIDFDWSKRVPMPPPFSAEWSGKILIDQPGDYTFALVSDDGSSLSIDDKLVVDATRVLLERRSGSINLSAGPHQILVRYFNLLFGGSIKLFYVPPGRPEQIVEANSLSPE